MYQRSCQPYAHHLCSDVCSMPHERQLASQAVRTARSTNAGTLPLIHGHIKQLLLPTYMCYLPTWLMQACMRCLVCTAVTTSEPHTPPQQRQPITMPHCASRLHDPGTYPNLKCHKTVFKPNISSPTREPSEGATVMPEKRDQFDNIRRKSRC